jgi:methionyl-tRNA synthetase
MSGIAKHFKPEQLAGKKVIIVANLAPRKIMNVESQGMLLSAEAPDGTLHLLETTAEPGSAVS